MVTHAAHGTEQTSGLAPTPDIAAMSGFLSACEAAAALGVTERTVRRAIARGELPAVKRGRAFQIAPGALDRYQPRGGRGHRRPSWPEQCFPVPRTSFVGRECQIAALVSLVQRDDARLLTLTGPGGVGKTRLALQVVARAAAAFPDGAVFVPLASVADPGLVLPAIVSALGLRESGDVPPLQRLQRHLRGKRLLLALDNVEQIPDVGSELARLLAACPGVAILVTSRSLLRVSDEQHVPVPPLHLPDSAPVAGNGLAALAEVEAVRLFLDRARGVTPDLAMTVESAPVIAAICRRLDGLPLALELAAARTRHLALDELLTRLDRALPLLTGGPRDAPGRLRTMRDAIAWSHGLLTPAEQIIFRRLSLFIGGFTLDAVEGVATDESEVGGRRSDRQSGRFEVGAGPEAAAVFGRSSDLRLPASDSFSGTPSPLDLLASLIDQNLVHRGAEQWGTTRYAMLETVREFGLEQLAASGEETRLRDAHADWCLALAERASPELSGPTQAAWFARLQAEQPNMRAALAWLLSRGDAERGLNLAGALTWFWTSRGYFAEAAAWFDALFALPVPVGAIVRARALLEAANVVHWQGHDERATTLAAEALATFRERDDRLWTGYALRSLGSIAIHRRDFAGAASLLQESAEILRVVGSGWDAAFALQLEGRLAVLMGDRTAAQRCFEEAAAAFRRVGDRGYVAAARGQQGAAALHVGDTAAARRAYAESLAIARELGELAWVAWSLAGAAHLAHRGGDGEQGNRLFAAAKRIMDETGQLRLDDGLSNAILDAFVIRDERPADAALATEQAIAAALALLAGPDEPDSPSPSATTLLTRREREVVRLLVDGLSDKEIGAALGITRHTVSNHVTAIREKLGAPSRAGAVAIAVRVGLLDSRH